MLKHVTVQRDKLANKRGRDSHKTKQSSKNTIERTRFAFLGFFSVLAVSLLFAVLSVSGRAAVSLEFRKMTRAQLRMSRSPVV